MHGERGIFTDGSVVVREERERGKKGLSASMHCAQLHNEIFVLPCQTVYIYTFLKFIYLWRSILSCGGPPQINQCMGNTGITKADYEVE